MLVKLTKKELQDLRLALLRAYGWSDLHDNAKANGRRWWQRESRFVNRCKRLESKLENAEALSELMG